jgi:multidrug resistance efflux pump
MNGSLTSISYDPHRPVTTRTEALAMAVESLTYAALGQRLGCSPEGARALAKRLRLPRQKANDGKALVVVDLTEIEHKPLPARSPAGHLSVTETLQAKIELLEAELTKVEAAAAGHRADFERERDRADKLLSEVLRATVDLIGAKEATARTEGDLAVVRAQAEGEIAAVRAHVEHLETELATVRARRRWWQRLTA